MNTQYTCKVVFYTVNNSKSIKNIQFFRTEKDAHSWASIQETRGFTPVSVSHDLNVDSDMIQVAGLAHKGHYRQVHEEKFPGLDINTNTCDYCRDHVNDKKTHSWHCHDCGSYVLDIFDTCECGFINPNDSQTYVTREAR